MCSTRASMAWVAKLRICSLALGCNACMTYPNSCVHVKPLNLSQNVVQAPRGWGGAPLLRGCRHRKQTRPLLMSKCI